mgnify:FL=1
MSGAPRTGIFLTCYIQENLQMFKMNSNFAPEFGFMAHGYS